MTFHSLFRKLFISGDWEIAFRKKCEGDFYDKSFKKIPNTKDYWFADPLLYENDGKTYLFCEAFNRKTMKGELGYFELYGDKVSEFKLILSPNYHMSFPNIFSVKGKNYMIPESGEGMNLELYEAAVFPDKWVKVKNLVEDVNYVDPTFCWYEGNMYIFVYIDQRGRYETKIYKFNVDQLELEYIESIYYTQNIGRSAGQFFKGDGGVLYRPVQLGEGEYGKRTALYKVDYVDGHFKEEQIEILANSKIKVSGKKGVDKLHTYSNVGEYEAIDFVNYNFDLFKRFKILYRQYLRSRRH
jgi:hypothetical protein